MSRPLAWLLGLLGLAFLTFLCVWTHAPAIEHDLKERTTAALDSRSFPGTAVSLSGRDVTLTGAVPTEPDRALALDAARAVPGVRVVHDALRIASDDGVPATEVGLFSLAEGLGGTLDVRGTVPDDASRRSLVDRIWEAFPDRTVQDNLVVGTAGTGWQSSIEALLPGLGAVQSPSVSVEAAVPATAGMDGSTIVLRGRVPSEAVKAEVEATAEGAVRTPYLFRSELVVGAGDLDETPGVANDQLETSGSEDAEVQAAESALNEVFSSGPIAFETATADLTASSRDVLDRAADVMERFPSVRAEVEGHTDSEDSSEHNLRLSQQRADAVVTYLTGRGIDASRLAARGYGEDQPIASNDTAEGRARNRRVVFRLER